VRPKVRGGLGLAGDGEAAVDFGDDPVLMVLE
jgi:hypothetical protein